MGSDMDPGRNIKKNRFECPKRFEPKKAKNGRIGLRKKVNGDGETSLSNAPHGNAGPSRNYLPPML